MQYGVIQFRYFYKHNNSFSQKLISMQNAHYFKIYRTENKTFAIRILMSCLHKEIFILSVNFQYNI